MRWIWLRKVKHLNYFYKNMGTFFCFFTFPIRIKTSQLLIHNKIYADPVLTNKFFCSFFSLFLCFFLSGFFLEILYSFGLLVWWLTVAEKIHDLLWAGRKYQHWKLMSCNLLEICESSKLDNLCDFIGKVTSE